MKQAPAYIPECIAWKRFLKAFSLLASIFQQMVAILVFLLLFGPRYTKKQCDEIGVDKKNCITQTPKHTTMTTKSTTMATSAHAQKCPSGQCWYRNVCLPEVPYQHRRFCCSLTPKGYVQTPLLGNGTCCSEGLEMSIWNNEQQTQTCCPPNYKRWDSNDKEVCCTQGFNYGPNADMCFIDIGYVPTTQRKDFEGMKKICKKFPKFEFKGMERADQYLKVRTSINSLTKLGAKFLISKDNSLRLLGETGTLPM
uniref:TB domain-containing protein n=2 Tax=Steinernema glaseri TaxID=37863 RepID=A0A1I7ZBJ0_9BILA